MRANWSDSHTSGASGRADQTAREVKYLGTGCRAAWTNFDLILPGGTPWRRAGRGPFADAGHSAGASACGGCHVSGARPS